MTQPDSVLSDGSLFASAILLAAGSGSRMQGTTADKSIALLNNRPTICYSVSAFLQSRCIQRLTIVYRDSVQKNELENALSKVNLLNTPIDWVQGGKERQDSVYAALQQQPKHCSYVFIHDSARPLVSSDAIRNLYETVLRDEAAALAHPVADTIKRIPNETELTQVKLEDLDRSRLWAIETPQVFKFELILKAYEYVIKNELRITDDTAAASAIGIGTTLVPNTTPNIKITHPKDLKYVAWLLAETSNR